MKIVYLQVAPRAAHITIEHCGIVYLAQIKSTYAQSASYQVVVSDEAFKNVPLESVAGTMKEAIELIENKIRMGPKSTNQGFVDGLSKKLQQLENPGVSMS